MGLRLGFKLSPAYFNHFVESGPSREQVNTAAPSAIKTLSLTSFLENKERKNIDQSFCSKAATFSIGLGTRVRTGTHVTTVGEQREVLTTWPGFNIMVGSSHVFFNAYSFSKNFPK